MSRTLAVALVALAVAACAPQFDIAGRDWTKAGAPVQEVTLDEMECARHASGAYGTLDLIVGGLADIARVKIEDAQMTDAFARCMAGKGYQPVAS